MVRWSKGTFVPPVTFAYFVILTTKLILPPLKVSVILQLLVQAAMNLRSLKGQLLLFVSLVKYPGLFSYPISLPPPKYL